MKKHFKLLIIFAAMLFAFAIMASAATDFTGYTAISSADDLLALMNSSSAVTGKYYLTKDIDLTGKTQSPIGEPNGKSFGTKASAAIFDGNGYTVKGVNISGGNYVGFFGVIENAEIRNLTIEGKVASTGSHVGGLVAYAKTNAVIENCVNNCTVTATGTSVGGILGNTELSSMVKLEISGCTNNAAIKASRLVGGVVGLVQRAKNCEVIIEGCINNGAVTATSTNADSKIGGILGASNRGSTLVEVKSFTVTKCMNTGDISGYFYVGGIIGEFCGTDSTKDYAYTKAKFHVTECFNMGNVVSTRSTNKEYSMTGGIIGYISQIGNVTDCLNVGTISAKLHGVGGLFGYIPKDSDFFGAKNNLNRAEVLLNGVAVTNNDYVNSIGGFMPYKPYGVNYYTGTLQGKVWENTASGAKSTQYTSSLFSKLNESGNWQNPEAPVLKEFAKVTCPHENISFTASGESIVVICDSCEKELYTDTTVTTTVFVDSEKGISAADGKDIGTEAAPFASMTEAFEYLTVAIGIKNSDAKITIAGKAVLDNTYETPATEKTITVSGGTLHFSGATATNRHLNLGGPMVFKNITFTSSDTDVRIYAQNHKLVMGEGIVMGNATSTTKVNSSVPFAVNDVKMFVLGGFYDNIPETMATDITIRSGEYYIVSGWNATNSKDATTGTARITVGKTDANDTLKICDLVAFNTIAQTRLTDDSIATMIIDGDADIARLIMSEREKTTNTVEANYTTHLILRGNISRSYRNEYMSPYGFDITGGSHNEESLGYHTFMIFTDDRVDGAVLAEYAFFGGDGYSADSTLTTGGYKPAIDGGDVTMTKHSYKEYCIAYLNGHTDGSDADTLCDECGADTACAHENAVPVVETESTCTVNGYEYTFCDDCGIMVNETELPLDENAHNYVWEAFDGGYRYVCSYNAEHVYHTYETSAAEFYVSDDGKTDGGLSASYPSNDFDTVMKLAAASGKPATVYIVGSITLNNNSTTNYEVYIEPSHSNQITVRGYKDTSGIIRIGSRNARLEYALSGDTTFEQVEFDTGISTNAIYIAARHNHLVMGDRITTGFGRNPSSTSNSGKLIVIGGCDNTIDNSACSKTDTHLTMKSGTYYMVIGGSSLKGCGLVNGTINIEVLGDITVGGIVTNQNGFVDRQFILGCHSANAGDISVVIDGNVTCTNAFCVGSYGTTTVNGQSVCRTAGDVTITIKSGSLFDYSFSGRSDRAYIYDEEFAKTYDPTANALEVADLVIFPLGNSHSHAIRGGVMKSVDNLYVYYNAKEYSTVQLAERFRYSLGGNDNFHMYVLPEKPCTSANGMHTPTNSGNVILEASCRGEGCIEYTCSDCGITYTESVARLAHSLTEGNEIMHSAANCSRPAIYYNVCENADCGYIVYSESGSANGLHTFENGICKFCNLNKQDLCNHENLSAVSYFTSGCGNGTQQTCLDCGKEFIEVDGADHNFGKYTVTVEPTDSTPGIKSRTCRSCGKVETAILYAKGEFAENEAIATSLDGSLTDISVESLKLSSVEKAVLNELLQDTNYGSEIKVSYVAHDAGTDIVYSIPLPEEYASMRNLKVIVKDDEGNIHTVDFKIEKGYIVFTF